MRARLARASSAAKGGATEPLAIVAALVADSPLRPPRSSDCSKVEIKVEKIAPGVAVLFGAGGNIGLSYGEDGNVIVDDQYAPLSDKIVAAIATVDPDPVRFVVNTHWHGDHTGGNEAMSARRGAVILAHDNVRTRMSTRAVHRRAQRQGAAPRRRARCRW